jgi:hypothetical protein
VAEEEAKENLADTYHRIAERSLGIVQARLEECSARDAMVVAATATDKELLLRGLFRPEKRSKAKLGEIVFERFTLAVREDEPPPAGSRTGRFQRITRWKARDALGQKLKLRVHCTFQQRRHTCIRVPSAVARSAQYLASSISLLAVLVSPQPLAASWCVLTGPQRTSPRQGGLPPR